MAWESLLQSGFKSHLHKRRNVRFKGLRRVYTPPHLLTAHTAAHTAKHGALWMGALSLPLDRFARFGTSVRAEARMGVLCYFCMGRRNIGKSREPSERRHAPCASLFRGSAGLRCPQHPSAADKTGQWKTGSAGSCRADFRFACARPA